MQTGIIVPSVQPPDASCPAVDYLDSGFFSLHGANYSLPTPGEVRARSERIIYSRPRPAVFESLGLLVKWGPVVSVAEAQCLRLVKQNLGPEILVPEVYGWRKDGPDVFIYMEYIHGVTLASRWEDLSQAQKSDVCNQLRPMMAALRRLKQDPSDPFIGSINREPLLYVGFAEMPTPGPFKSVPQFNDYFCWLPGRKFPDGHLSYDYFRPHLPDDGQICFSHSDLHLYNIIVSPDDQPSIKAIVDWEQAGWYPDYWEFCRTCYTGSSWEDWRDIWVETFLSPLPQTYRAYGQLLHSIGAI